MARLKRSLIETNQCICLVCNQDLHVLLFVEFLFYVRGFNVPLNAIVIFLIAG